MEIWAVFPAEEDAISPYWMCKLERAHDQKLYWRGYNAPWRESTDSFFKDAIAKGALLMNRHITWKETVLFKMGGGYSPCRLWEPYLVGDLTALLVKVNENDNSCHLS